MKSKFESRYKVYSISNDIMDKYLTKNLYENTPEPEKTVTETIRKIVKENFTPYEKMIYELYFINYSTVTSISNILKQNLKTVYQRVYKIRSIIRILYPVYELSYTELKRDLNGRFSKEEIKVLVSLQKRYNIKVTVRRTNMSFDKVKKLRMLCNKVSNIDTTPSGVYLNAIRNLNSLRRELRVD